MIKYFTYIIAFFLTTIGFAQDTLLGYAPDYAGEEVTLYTYQDYVTMTRKEIGKGLVSEKDSIFRIPLQNKNTIKGVVEIAKTEATLYLAPKTTYRVFYEKPYNQPLSFSNQLADLTFFGLDTTDINYRILQYNMWFDNFVAYYEVEIARGKFPQYLDTFKLELANVYKDVDDDYFLTYVRYNIALIELTIATHGGKERLRMYLDYIEPFPVYYENDQYMEFLLNFYHLDFDDYPPEMESQIYLAIYKSSPTLLMKELHQDLLLVRPDVRELVMINKLGKLFYEDNRNKQNILVMLDSLSSHSITAHDATVSANIKTYLTSLEPGFPAPGLNIPYKDTVITWHKYKGRYVYMNFFATWNERSMNEMKLIQGLQQTFGNDIYFISVCTDKDRDKYEAYLQENPEMDWDIVYVGDEHIMLEEYRVKTFPQYFLIDQEGFLAAAPAPGPAPDGEYESIEQTFIAIYKALHPQRGRNY